MLYPRNFQTEFRGGPFYFEEGGGGERIGLCKNFFPHWPVFLVTVKAVQEFFSQIFHSPTPPQKSNGPPLSRVK